MEEEAGDCADFFSHGDFTSYGYKSFKPYNSNIHHQYSYSYKPACPPLTAIDRFLSGQSHHLTKNSSQLQADHDHDQNPVVSANELWDFSSSSTPDDHQNHHHHYHHGAITSGVHFSWPISIAKADDHGHNHHQDQASFFEGLFVDENPMMNRTQERMNINTCSKEGVVEVVEMINSCKEMGKRAHKKASSVALIKGQWTDEEDR